MTARELAAAALVTPDAAGALADHLDEIGDPRGRLLRIRWRRFRTEYHNAGACTDRAKEFLEFVMHRTVNECDLKMYAEAGRKNALGSFARYIRVRFAKELA